jgi:hypothetical protein
VGVLQRDPALGRLADVRDDVAAADRVALTISATGELLALCVVDEAAHARPSKKAMPKPSLCSSARVAKPVKLNTMSVGVLQFMPSSWHMGSAGAGRGGGGAVPQYRKRGRTAANADAPARAR